jgi:hypothetical protein
MNKADTFAQLIEVASKIKSEFGFNLQLDEEQGLINIERESEVLATAKYLQGEEIITFFELQGSVNQSVVLHGNTAKYLGDSNGYLDRSAVNPAKAVEHFCKGLNLVCLATDSLAPLNKKWNLDIEPTLVSASVHLVNETPSVSLPIPAINIETTGKSQGFTMGTYLTKEKAYSVLTKPCEYTSELQERFEIFSAKHLECKRLLGGLLSTHGQLMLEVLDKVDHPTSEKQPTERLLVTLCSGFISMSKLDVTVPIPHYIELNDRKAKTPKQKRLLAAASSVAKTAGCPFLFGANIEIA